MSETNNTSNSSSDPQPTQPTQPTQPPQPIQSLYEFYKNAVKQQQQQNAYDQQVVNSLNCQQQNVQVMLTPDIKALLTEVNNMFKEEHEAERKVYMTEIAEVKQQLKKIAEDVKFTTEVLQQFFVTLNEKVDYLMEHTKDAAHPYRY